jgi:hypothetical protein
MIICVLGLLYLIFAQLCGWLVLLSQVTGLQERRAARAAARGRHAAPHQSSAPARLGRPHGDAALIRLLPGRLQAHRALLACNFFETVTLTGSRRYSAGPDARMNSIMERWAQTCQHGLLDRTLIWNQRHLLHSLREFEHFYNERRPHRTLRARAALCQLPEPIADPERIAHLDVRRRCDPLPATRHRLPFGGTSSCEES